IRVALVGFGLAHPLAQRLVVDAEITGYVGDGTTGLEDHPGAALQQPFGVLSSSCHGLIGSLPPGGILASRSPSNPAWLRRALWTARAVEVRLLSAALRPRLRSSAGPWAPSAARAGSRARHAACLPRSRGCARARR